MGSCFMPQIKEDGNPYIHDTSSVASFVKSAILETFHFCPKGLFSCSANSYPPAPPPPEPFVIPITSSHRVGRECSLSHFTPIPNHRYARRPVKFRKVRTSLVFCVEELWDGCNIFALCISRLLHSNCIICRLQIPDVILLFQIQK